jgi:lipoprotein-releasing system permease protein
MKRIRLPPQPAFRYFTAKKKSPFLSAVVLISTLGVVVGVAALLIVLGVMNGFHTQWREKILGTTAHAIILKYHNEPIMEVDEVISRVQEVPNVVAAAPFIYSKAIISFENQTDGIAVKGIDPTLEEKVSQLRKNLVLGTMELAESDMPSILLGVDLADNLRAHLQDTLLLATLQRNPISGTGFVPKVKKFRVAGIFDSGFYEYNASLAYISSEAAQEIFQLPGGFTGIALRMQDMYQAKETAQQITGMLGYPFRVADWMDLNKNLFAALQLEKKTMFIILTLIIVVAAFGISGTLIMTVMRKTREIGILRSMGATQRSIMKIFMLEGGMVGSIGVGLGILLGLFLSVLLRRYEFISIPGDIYFISKLPVEIRTIDCALVAVAALGITFLATIYPSYIASRLTPVEAIKHE